MYFHFNILLLLLITSINLTMLYFIQRQGAFIHDRQHSFSTGRKRFILCGTWQACTYWVYIVGFKRITVPKESGLLSEGGSRRSVFIHQNRAQFIGCYKIRSFSMRLIFVIKRSKKKPSLSPDRTASMFLKV